MNRRLLAWRGACFYWRSHLGVMIGVMIGTAVLTGALQVGRSVSETLHHFALARLGGAEYALQPPERFFRAALADDLSQEMARSAIPILRVNGSALRLETRQRANRVQVLGVDDRFWELGEGLPLDVSLGDGDVILNPRLAKQLDAVPGDEILLRVERPSSLPRKAPLSVTENMTTALRLTVRAIATDAQMGRFDLRANQMAPFNAFVSLTWLQRQTELSDKANLLLLAHDASTLEPLAMNDAEDALRSTWTLADAQLELLDLSEQGWIELRSERVFLEDRVVDIAKRIEPSAMGVLTYLVNALERDDRSTPYSMVAAVGSLGEDVETPGDFPTDLGDEFIAVNQWLADDLQLSPGDELRLRYLIFGPMRNLIEETRAFTVRDVLPMRGPHMDTNLMPEYPGLADSEHCRDWNPGFVIDLDAIRDKDEEYWDEYRGAPKAMLSLEAGKAMWANRFGSLTAIRFPSEHWTGEALETAILEHMRPAYVGMTFLPVRQHALDASAQAISFGPLFLGLSFFLIVAALLLVGLLFLFSVEQRQSQTGIFLALGFTPKQVRSLYLVEGVIISILGGIAGVFAAAVYARITLWALETVWSGAVASAELHFHFGFTESSIGLFASVAMSVVAILFALRKQAAAPPQLLLSPGGAELCASPPSARRHTIGIYICVAALFLIILIMQFGGADSASATGVFFGVGVLFLVAWLGLISAILTRLTDSTGAENLSLYRLGVRNAVRRRGRSLAIVAMLACGAFLVLAVGANRKPPVIDPTRRDSGTGGFTLYAETTLPLYYDLNTAEGLEQFGLIQDDLPGVSFVPMRVRDGDDASCLNLNRAQTPRLLGLDHQYMIERDDPFVFVSALNASSEGSMWLSLSVAREDGSVPAVADQASILWALGRSLGDALTYLDGEGNPFDVRLEAALGGSILQGSILIGESDFVDKFPNDTGYRAFLIDAPLDQANATAALLTEVMQDFGIEVIRTKERLAALNAVENTYLSIFLALGALGLLLGVGGLGVMVMRNALERRAEIALLRALGYPSSQVVRLLFYEHGFLFIAGLASGGLAGLFAVYPSMAERGAEAPYAMIVFTLGGLLISGVFFVWLAARAALRATLIRSLQDE